MSISGMVTIHPGATIMSADGKKLGTVKEVGGDKFKVDARWAPDYWLGTEVVDNASDELVQLFITKGAIGAAKIRSFRSHGELPSSQ